MDDSTSSAGKALAVVLSRQELMNSRQIQTWESLLSEVLPEDDRPLPMPRELVRHYKGEKNIPPELIDAEYKSRITTEMLSQLSPDSRFALDRLTHDLKLAGDPQAVWTDSVRRRVVTLLAYDRVPYPLVITEIAKALETTENGRLSDNYHRVYSAIRELGNEASPARPVYDSDEFARLADLVIREISSSVAVTAKGESEFYFDDLPINSLIIDSIISKIVTLRCDIWNRQRNEPATVNSRFIKEIRCAVARKCAKLSMPRIENEKHDLQIATSKFTYPVGDFADEALLLAPGEWTASAEIWGAYIAGCTNRGATPEIAANFFKEFSRWGAGRVRRMKKWIAGGRIPGYVGVILRAGGPGGPGLLTSRAHIYRHTK